MYAVICWKFSILPNNNNNKKNHATVAKKMKGKKPKVTDLIKIQKVFK